MFFHHVHKHLSAFSHGELSRKQASRISEHLSTCERCQAAHEEIRLGIRLAQHLPRVLAPPDLSSSLEPHLRSRALGPMASPSRIWALRWSLATIVALITAAASAFFWYQRVRSLVSFRPALSELSRFEKLALDLHLQQKKGISNLDYRSDDPDALNRWVAQTSGVKLTLATKQPAEDVGRYKLQGAKVVKQADREVVSVFYRIDQSPVILIAVSTHNLGRGEVPSEGRWQKKILHRVTFTADTHLLSWTRDNQSYVLASDLPGLGRQACFVCHTNPRRREIILTAKLEH